MAHWAGSRSLRRARNDHMVAHLRGCQWDDSCTKQVAQIARAGQRRHRPCLPGRPASGGSSKFAGGTGEFDGAHGNAFVKGVTMFAPGVAATSIAWYNGELCR